MRHPMLGRSMLGAGAFAGEWRSGFGDPVWRSARLAVVDLILINKMEPAWQRPGAGPVVNDVLYIALSVLLFLVIGYVHIWLGYNPFG